MAEKRWTTEQAQAIQARGGALLVSAAAGSGKTAVLVERILRLITDEERPVDADRLLVATFSRAAAAQMRQRALEGLEALLAADPKNDRLRRQKLLLGRARIGTVHSFCLQLIRENFQLLELSADFRIGEEKEMLLLRQQMAEEVIGSYYQEKRQDFYGLVELISGPRDDRRLEETLLKLYDFVRAHPFYERWLLGQRDAYLDRRPVEESAWGRRIFESAGGLVEYCLRLCQNALGLMAGEEKMEQAYGPAFREDLSRLERLKERIAQRDWDGCCQELDSLSFARLGALRGYQDSRLKDQVTALRSQVKERLGRLRGRYFCSTAREYREDLEDLAPKVAVLFDMTIEFSRRLEEEKRQRRLVDFSDLEQLALRLLVQPEGEGCRPTALARQIQSRYDAVMVDEFQDTNQAQELLFQALSRGGENLFLVGDVKQSIYRFRQAMPEIFIAKKDAFSPYDGVHYPAKILLRANFRSRPEVTGAVNFFFGALMSRQLGEIDYNEEEALVSAGAFPSYGRAQAELHLYSPDPQGGEDKLTQEARCCAGIIEELLESGYQVAEGGGMRPVRLGDICVLLRSTSGGKIDAYLKELERLEIPACSASRSGFLATREVMAALALLQAVQNPLEEVQLAAAMISPAFGFTPEELARIRLSAQGESFWTAVLRYGERDAKTTQFLAVMQRLRRQAAQLPVADLLRSLYRETCLVEKFAMAKGGAQRRANLLLLLEYAARGQQGGYAGADGFLRYLRLLEERGEDLEPAALGESRDAVSVMSIHRSKGLEFPVVILADCDRPFNTQELSEPTLLHPQMGFACMRQDSALGRRFTTVPLQAIRLESARADLSEEMRIFYVALTRAKEKLILLGKCALPERRLAALAQPLAGGKLSHYAVSEGKSYLDWALMAALHHPDCGELRRLAGEEDLELLPAQAPLRVAFHTAAGPQPAALPRQQPQAAASPALVEQIARRIDDQYPYEEEVLAPAKMGVSEIVRGAAQCRFDSRPAFLARTQGLTGAQRGNAVHRFLQFADFSRAAADLPAEIARLTGQGYLTAEERRAVEEAGLERFFASRLFLRMQASPRLERELRFLSIVGGSRLARYGLALPNGGGTVVQGVADCVFLENGRAVIVDFKTDRVQSAQQLAERYTPQLSLYRELLADTLACPMGECILYSTCLGLEIPLTLADQEKIPSSP